MQRNRHERAEVRHSGDSVGVGGPRQTEAAQGLGEGRPGPARSRIAGLVGSAAGRTERDRCPPHPRRGTGRPLPVEPHPGRDRTPRGRAGNRHRVNQHAELQHGALRHRPSGHGVRRQMDRPRERSAVLRTGRPHAAGSDEPDQTRPAPRRYPAVDPRADRLL